MVLFFKQNPFLYPVLCFIPGIWLGYEYPSIFGWSLWISGAAFVCYTGLIFSNLKDVVSSFRLRWVPGVLFSLFIFCAGICFAASALPPLVHESGQVEGTARIGNVLGKSDRYTRIKITVKSLNHQSISSKQPVHLVAYFSNDRGDIFELQGKEIRFKGMIKPFDKAIVPGQFDYGHYLMLNGFSGLIFIKENQLLTKQSFFAGGFIKDIKLRFQKTIRDEFGSGDENGIMQSLILGDRAELSHEVKQNFVQSGVIHVLAVSGMHVAILYWFLMCLTFFMSRTWIRVLRLILIAAVLWFYAWLTMFSPSVLRATVMFSILMVGLEFRRSSGGINSLCAAAFVVLMYDPLALFNAGFWLSHLAVLGIIVFYQPINRLFSFEFIGWRWSWSLIAVSLAAQITTFPITLMLFQGFPTYFLLANILILPVVSIILIGGMVLLFLPQGSVLSQFISSPLADLVWYMNRVADLVANLPGAYMKGYSLTLTEVIIIFGVVLFVYQYSLWRRFYLLMTGQVLTLLFLLSVGTRIFIASQQSIVTIYSHNGKSIINIIEGESNLALCSDRVSRNELAFLYSGMWGNSFKDEPQLISIDSLFRPGTITHLNAETVHLCFVDGTNLVSGPIVLPTDGDLSIPELVFYSGPHRRIPETRNRVYWLTGRQKVSDIPLPENVIPIKYGQPYFAQVLP